RPRRRDQMVPSLLDVAGFDAVDARIVEKQRVEIGLFDFVEGKVLGASVGQRLWMTAKKIATEFHHVRRGRVLALNRQTVGIAEMSVAEAQFRRLRVHLRRETVRASAQVFGERYRGIIAGRDHEPEQEITYRDLLPDAKKHARDALVHRE